MARRKLENRLIDRKYIKEEIRLIRNSETDYVSEEGSVYKEYEPNRFLKKSTFVNNHNGYLYTNITYPEGQKQKRLHRLVAEAFVPNPDNYPVAMHIDDNKANPKASNLKWGTVSDNTKDAFDHGLLVNDKGYDDSQSMPVKVYDRNFNEIGRYGSVSECSRVTGITKTGILYSCKNKPTKGSKSGYYFRFDK